MTTGIALVINPKFTACDFIKLSLLIENPGNDLGRFTISNVTPVFVLPAELLDRILLVSLPAFILHGAAILGRQLLFE